MVIKSVGVSIVWGKKEKKEIKNIALLGKTLWGFNFFSCQI
jgi:hypothetical protein